MYLLMGSIRTFPSWNFCISYFLFGRINKRMWKTLTALAIITAQLFNLTKNATPPIFWIRMFIGFYICQTKNRRNAPALTTFSVWGEISNRCYRQAWDSVRFDISMEDHVNRNWIMTMGRFENLRRIEISNRFEFSKPVM